MRPADPAARAREERTLLAACAVVLAVLWTSIATFGLARAQTGMALGAGIGIGIALSLLHILHTRNRIQRLRGLHGLIEQLSQAREGEADANRMKSRFIASLSHELRTPLNAILGLSELVRDDPGHPDTARRADLVHGSGQHLHALLDSVLDLARIEAGRMEVQRAPVDLAGTVRRLAELHRGGAARKGLSLTFDSGLPAAQTVLADTDATKFTQVLNNLLNNAVKFTSSGGVRVRVSASDGAFVTEVEDTGCGIPPERLASVFDRFTGAATPGSAREQGSGLGLSLSRELVRLLGGSIEIASRPGSGTRVTVRLPGARLAQVQA